MADGEEKKDNHDTNFRKAITAAYPEHKDDLESEETFGKFMAVWTIPMLSEAIATQSTGYEMAQGLLPILNVTVPYSLYTSFDYLGFWLYSVFALLVCIPMTRGSLSARIIGITLGLFGVIYNVLVAFILAGSIGRPQITDSLMTAALLLLVVSIAALFLFRSPANIHDKGSA